MSELQSALAAAERVFRLLDETEEPVDSTDAKVLTLSLIHICIMCGTCEGECPVGAIAEGEGKYEIDADACIECGSCAAACPVGAISE